jgi:hypothetical protein
MRGKSLFARVGLIVAMSMIPMLAGAGSASAVTLNGDWAPFARCPVDNSAMLAADGVTIVADCLAVDSPSGSVKIGSTAVTTGDTNLQLGLLENNSTPVLTASGVAPAGGAVVAAPANVPGGLLGLMCPSSIPAISQICATLVGSPLNTVTAVVQSAGNPSKLSLLNAFTARKPIVSLPVKIKLQNPILGSNCYIGSNASPVVLRPENLVAPTFQNGETFDPNGTPDPNGVLQTLILTGTEGDTTFAVPAATGCGGQLSALITPIVNAKIGLPSPSGKNSVVLHSAASDLAFFGNPSAYAPHEGQTLAADWHSAVLP